MLWFNTQPLPIGYYFAYIQNWQIKSFAENNFLSVTWSLCVEEQFYLVYPILIKAVTLARIPAIFAFSMLFCFAIKFYSDSYFAYSNLLSRCDNLFGGAFLYYLYSQRSHIKLPRLRTMVFAFVVLTLSLFNPQSHGKPWIHLAMLFSFLFIFYKILTVPDSTRILRNHKLINKAIVNLSDISYFIYLFHQPILGLVFFLFYGTTPSLSSVGDFFTILTSIILLLIFGKLSFKYFERPLIRLSHRLTLY
jgi:peptidoglycan/LPS O-acetylase OafA/YrhL